MLITGIKFNKRIPTGTKSVIFTDVKAPSGATLTDVSEAQDGSIVAWKEDSTFKISTQKTGTKVCANPDLSYMFSANKNTACKNLTYIDVSNLDTSQVTDMSKMFYLVGESASTFTLKGLNGWDTSKVENMSHMFYAAGYNASIWSIGDLSSWNTSKVTDMSYMFYKAGYQSNMFNLDLSNWSIDEKADIEDIFFDAGHNATEWNIDCSSWVLWNQISNQRLSIR